MRTEIPPPGRAMSFPEWAEAIVAGIRRYLPDARAVRKGHRQVVIRHSGREAQLEDDGGAFVVRFRAGDSAVTMSGLVDRDRRDTFTVANLSHSVAGFFDGRFEEKTRNGILSTLRAAARPAFGCRFRDRQVSMPRSAPRFDFMTHDRR
jgi:hypothetical protein